MDGGASSNAAFLELEPRVADCVKAVVRILSRQPSLRPPRLESLIPPSPYLLAAGLIVTSRVLESRGARQGRVGSDEANSHEYLRARDGLGEATSPDDVSREAASAQVSAVPERSAGAKLGPSAARKVSPPSPATVATTKLTVDGGVVADSFTGDGSTLTSLNADNLSSGTVPELRIADEIARDGELVVAVVAAFALEAACPGAYGSLDRYTDCDNGTVRDNNTGLIWLKNANWFGARNWSDSQGDASGLAEGACGLTDGSTAGDWRLASASEMCSVYAGGTLLPCPAHAAADSLLDSSLGAPYVSNTAGDGVWSATDPFTAVQTSAYWSSTTVDGFPSVAYIARLDGGWLTTNTKTISAGHYVWPVRDAL